MHERIGPRCRSVPIPTSDGWTLAADVHQPPTTTTSKVVIVLSAIGAVRGRYAPFARHLSSAGWTVITFDYRGIGDSQAHATDAPRPNLTDWGEQDLHAVIDWADRSLRPDRLTAVAHSIGGQLVGLATNHRRLQAVMVVSAPRPLWWLFDRPYRYVVLAFFRVWIPFIVAVLGRLPMRLARLHDLPADVARDWARTSLALEPKIDALRYRRQRERFFDYRIPTLLLSFEDDHYIAPRQTVTQLIDTFYVHAPWVRCHIDSARTGLGAIGHSGFFDGRVPTRWWDEAQRWLDHAPTRRAPAFDPGSDPSFISLSTSPSTREPAVAPGRSWLGRDH